jgi:UDP-apiose/xylose synthase
MNLAYRRIAVLGAGGFLGSHLVPALRRRFDAEVVAVDGDLGKLAPGDPGVQRRQVRIDEPGLIDELAASCEVVLSLTAICNPSIYNQRPLEVIDASYGDVLPVVKACARRGRWLVHFSTCEVYGKFALAAADGQPTPLMAEDSSALWLGPVDKERWSYACAKQLLERTLFAYGRHHGLPFTIVRPFNVIGPRMDFVDGIDGQGVPRVLAAFMGALLKGEELLLVDGGQQRRSFIYVDDFVEGILAMLERPAACRGEIFNLGHPANDVTIAALAAELCSAYAGLVPGARPRTRVVSARELYGEGYDDSTERIPDISKAVSRLGFAPRLGLAQMLPPIIADYRARYLPRLGLPEVKAAR